jgi:hypothetical protein
VLSAFDAGQGTVIRTGAARRHFGRVLGSGVEGDGRLRISAPVVFAHVVLGQIFDGYRRL